MKSILYIDAINIRAGGGLTHLLELINSMSSIDFLFDEVFLVSNTKTLTCLPKHPRLTLHSHHLLNRSYPFIFLWRLFWFPRLASRFARSSTVGFYPAGTGRSRYFNVVNMCQNMLLHDSKERNRFLSYPLAWLKLSALSILQKKRFQNSQGVLFISEYARETVTQHNKISNSAVVYHGIDSRFKPIEKRQQSLNQYSFSNPFRLLYVSSFYPYKHHGVLVGAIRNLRARGIPVTLELVGGSGILKNNAIVKDLEVCANPDSGICYHGTVGYSEIERMYQNCDACVYASTCENMPNILIEAMACGVPILSSSYQPMPEFLPYNYEFYFDPTCGSATEVAIENFLLDQPGRLNAAKAVRLEASSYGWDKCAQETFHFLYSFVASENTPSPYVNHSQRPLDL